MARPPHGGHAHRDAAAKPPCAAKRTQAQIAPAATAAPAESPALGGPECPQGETGPRAHEFGAAHARPTGRSAAQRWTGAHGLEPRTAEINRSNLDNGACPSDARDDGGQDQSMDD